MEDFSDVLDEDMKKYLRGLREVKKSGNVSMEKYDDKKEENIPNKYHGFKNNQAFINSLTEEEVKKYNKYISLPIITCTFDEWKKGDYTSLSDYLDKNNLFKDYKYDPNFITDENNKDKYILKIPDIY
jgi:hypothetical protein